MSSYEECSACGENYETIRPICANCRHAIKPWLPFLPWKCGFPPLGHYINGKPVECILIRMISRYCGENGRFFEEKS